jgi:hypothetical protein
MCWPSLPSQLYPPSCLLGSSFHYLIGFNCSRTLSICIMLLRSLYVEIEQRWHTYNNWLETLAIERISRLLHPFSIWYTVVNAIRFVYFSPLLGVVEDAPHLLTGRWFAIDDTILIAPDSTSASDTQTSTSSVYISDLLSEGEEKEVCTIRVPLKWVEFYTSPA